MLTPRDPGVENWIDTAGHHIGCVFVRWLLADAVPQAPTARVVKIAELTRG